MIAEVICLIGLLISAAEHLQHINCYCNNVMFFQSVWMSLFLSFICVEWLLFGIPFIS